ncbi:hypothetical protein C7820_3348 [Paenibacillus sp. VMFN-D1]|nr:hypothetical protein C7820_3348 [Paenibacillus sp. VMFN-D1]
MSGKKIFQLVVLIFVIIEIGLIGSYFGATAESPTQ